MRHAHARAHTEGSQRVCPLLMFVSKWKFPRASRKTLGSSDLGEVIGSGLMVSYGPFQLSAPVQRTIRLVRQDDCGGKTSGARATLMQVVPPGRPSSQPSGQGCALKYSRVVPFSKMNGAGFPAMNFAQLCLCATRTRSQWCMRNPEGEGDVWHARTHTHARAHARTHAHTHTRTRTHTQTYSPESDVDAAVYTAWVVGQRLPWSEQRFGRSDGEIARAPLAGRCRGRGLRLVCGGIGDDARGPAGLRSDRSADVKEQPLLRPRLL